MTRHGKEELQAQAPAARIHARITPDREGASGIAESVRRLQQTAGNGAVQRALREAQGEQAPPAVQAKLVVGAAGDEFEQEADRMASSVVDGSAGARVPAANAAAPAVQRSEDEEAAASQPAEEEKEDEGEAFGA
jgi:hypothetical protein